MKHYAHTITTSAAQIIDDHDSFDLLWSKLKMSIIDARTKREQVQTDTTTINHDQTINQ
jgi:hypothetical protein